MIVCECGREFKKQGHLNMHKSHCLGARRCQNPRCNVPLLKLSQKKYCSSRCATIHTAPGRKHSEQTKVKISLALGGRSDPKKCRFCGKPVRCQFCNTFCQKEFRYQEYIKKWKNSTISGTGKSGPSSMVRRYMLEKYHYRCQECGWGIKPDKPGNSPLCIHHIDGNRKNNVESNLETLCPNCHILTENYGGRNRIRNEN